MIANPHLMQLQALNQLISIIIMVSLWDLNEFGLPLIQNTGPMTLSLSFVVYPKSDSYFNEIFTLQN